MTDSTRFVISGIGGALFLLGVVWFAVHPGALRDMSTAEKKPFSFARVQLLAWTTIIIGSWLFVYALLGVFWEFNATCLTLLGISSMTTVAGRVIDNRDEADPAIDRHQDAVEGSKGFLTDILSDAQGLSIHRFQSLVFNVAFGFWFVLDTAQNLDRNAFPTFEPITMTLLMLSSGTYLATKAMENKREGEPNPQQSALQRSSPSPTPTSGTMPKQLQEELAGE